MEIRLLGPVTAVDGPRELALGGGRQRAVLAWLALHSPRSCTVPSIVDAVWGEDPPASARNAVQVYVSGLRKALPPECGPTRVGDGYCLPAHVVVDAVEFREQVAAGGAALRAGDSGRAEQVLSSALERWRGEPLDGLSEVPFRETVAAALGDARVGALRDRAAALLDLGRSGEAAEVARAAVDEAPYDEHAWRLLATARYHQGRQQDALDLLRTLRRRLADDLGLDPSADVVELERLVLAHEVPGPARGGPAEGDEAHSRRPSLPAEPHPFVGREEDLARLVDALERHRLVSVVGLGGMGKTTLATVLCHRLAELGHAVAFCELESEVAAVAAWERVCRQVGTDPGEDPVAALGAVAHSWVLVLDNTEQVEDLARGVPAVLSNPHLRLVVTSRRPLHLREELVLALGPLELAGADGTSSAAALVLARSAPSGAAGAAGDVAAAQRVAELLDGIPLAIEIAGARAGVLGLRQLARRLEEGRLSALDSSREVDRPARQSSLAVVLEATVADLDVEVRRVAEVLGVCDGWTTLELVERLVGPGGSALDALTTLRETGLVEADGEGRFRLRVVVRQYLRARHPDVSEVERKLVDDVRAVAEGAAPSLQGELAEETVRALAADHEPITGALLRCVERGWSRDAAAIAVALNLYWLKSARLAEGRRWLQAAAAMDGHRAVDRARLRVLVGTYFSYFGDSAGVPLLEQSLADAERAGAPADRVLVNGWCSLAALHAFRGETAAAQERTKRANDLAATTGDTMLVALARDAWAYVAAATGDFEGALEANLRGARDARAMGDRYLLVSSLQAVVENLLQLERPQEAAEVSEELYEAVRALEPGPLLSQVLVTYALGRLVIGDVSAAKGCLVEAIRVIRDRFANSLALADALMALAATLTVEGRDREAARAWSASDLVFAEEQVEVDTHLLPVLVRSRAALESRVPGPQLSAWMLGAGDVDRVVEAILAA